MLESPGDLDLLTRPALESPRLRAARLAYQRWVTIQRLWAVMDRLDLVDEGDRVRFMCRALWPSMSEVLVEQLAVRAGAPDAFPTWRLRRPSSPAEALGRDAAELIRTYTPAE